MSHKIDFTVRDIFSDPEAKAEWEALKLEVVPVVVLGERRLAIYHVDQLRNFLELTPEKESTTFKDLASALDRILEAVERAVMQVPVKHLATPTPNRGRDLKEMVFNIFRQVNILCDSLDTGLFESTSREDFRLSRIFDTPDKLAGYCRSIRVRCSKRTVLLTASETECLIRTPRGTLSFFKLFEAKARHAAQHLRQIYAFMKAVGIEPRQELKAEGMWPIKLGQQLF